MIQQQELRQYHAQQELRNCGFTPESINAIKSTTIITRNGAQHVVPASQKHLDQSSSKSFFQSSNVSSDSNSNSALESLQQQFLDQQRSFSRFKQFSDRRIMELEHQLSKTMTQVKDMVETVKTLKSNAGVAQRVSANINRKDKEPMTQAIDRNNVAPSTVRVEDIFYSGSKR